MLWGELMFANHWQQHQSMVNHHEPRNLKQFFCLRRMFCSRTSARLPRSHLAPRRLCEVGGGDLPLRRGDRGTAGHSEAQRWRVLRAVRARMGLIDSGVRLRTHPYGPFTDIGGRAEDSEMEQSFASLQVTLILQLFFGDPLLPSQVRYD